MGVKSLTKLLQRYAPQSIVLRNSSDYHNTRIAIDASCYLNRFVFGKDYARHSHQHIAGFYSLANFCRHYEILPIFVFDGNKRVDSKKRELDRRRLVRTKVAFSLAVEKERTTRMKLLSETLERTSSMPLPEIRQHLKLALDNLEASIDVVSPELTTVPETVVDSAAPSADVSVDFVPVTIAPTPEFFDQELAPASEPVSELVPEPISEPIPEPIPELIPEHVVAPVTATAEVSIDLTSVEPTPTPESPLVSTTLSLDVSVDFTPDAPDFAPDAPTFVQESMPVSETPETTEAFPTPLVEVSVAIDSAEPTPAMEPVATPTMETLPSDVSDTPESTAVKVVKSVEESAQDLFRIAEEIQRSMIVTEDKVKYTQTVRNLITREYDLLRSFADGQDVHSDFEEVMTDSNSNLNSLETRAIAVTPALRNESAIFLKAMGLPVFMCDYHEAEAMCAQMATQGIVDYVDSEDLDVCAFGEKPLLRRLFRSDKPVMEIDPLKARTELGISKESFIDLCILCGTDFSDTIPSVGPIRALSLIREYGSIEGILANQDKFKPGENFTYKEARAVFFNPPLVETDAEIYAPVEPTDDFAQLLQEYNLGPEELDQLDEKLRLEIDRRNVALTMELKDEGGNYSLGVNPFK